MLYEHKNIFMCIPLSTCDLVALKLEVKRLNGRIAIKCKKIAQKIPQSSGSCTIRLRKCVFTSISSNAFCGKCCRLYQRRWVQGMSILTTVGSTGPELVRSSIPIYYIRIFICRQWLFPVLGPQKSVHQKEILKNEDYFEVKNQ